MTRKWSKEHKGAGYHEQEWLPVTKDDPVIGDYQGKNGTVKVRYCKGPTGPEFEIEWESGQKVTVLDATVVVEYLTLDGAKKVA